MEMNQSYKIKVEIMEVNQSYKIKVEFDNYQELMNF